MSMKANLTWADTMGMAPFEREKVFDAMVSVMKEEAEALKQAMKTR